MVFKKIFHLILGIITIPILLIALFAITTVAFSLGDRCIYLYRQIIYDWFK